MLCYISVIKYLWNEKYFTSHIFFFFFIFFFSKVLSKWWVNFWKKKKLIPIAREILLSYTRTTICRRRNDRSIWALRVPKALKVEADREIEMAMNSSAFKVKYMHCSRIWLISLSFSKFTNSSYVLISNDAYSNLKIPIKWATSFFTNSMFLFAYASPDF